MSGQSSKRQRIQQARAALIAAHEGSPVQRYGARMAKLEAAAKRAREAKAARWCILRCSSVRTLPLARSLEAAGFEVWAPANIQMRSRPRSSAKVEIEQAMLPSFVFARADTQEMVNDLFRAHALPAAHPPFTIFHSDGRVPTIAETSFRAIRAAEADSAKALHDVAAAKERKALKQERREFSIGQPVKVTNGAFTGLPAVVLSCNGKRAKVDIGGVLPFDVATWQLVPDGVSGTSSPEDIAAIAA